ncbi:MAG: S9 family peptidase, partial [Bacteroidales bacterium]|nr:S9 family peptidase [Bacteroidales bacterium]
NFDPSRKYPVIEYIYAGPHSSFVPKSFFSYNGSLQPLAELGFILVQIDGMGTSNRSKAFHDVAWKNLKDAGFPDRILWMKDAASKYSYMDIENVGIFGTSAGGQNSAGAVIFHPEFYDVAVSSCGCHDNRMDKIWWNEQFMGWPVGPEYAESSNVENAHLMKGRMMLINGEMDFNVDPASTVQLVDALIKANKEFEYILVPGMGHSSGGQFGEHKRRDYFVKHLLGIDPPGWSEFDK